MASKKGGKCKRNYYQAKLVTNVGTCVFCKLAVDDEIIYGKLYAIGDIQCHYFCALLSCCLVQKGSDDEGLFGFLYLDILAEVERSKKHRCSYCNQEGANLGCSVAQCRKQFHLPCGRQRDAVSLFYGNYKSFCANHAPKQKVVDSIMPNVKLRIAEQRRLNGQQKCSVKSDDVEDRKMVEVLCVICYEEVEGFPTNRTFWPPCCARDAWFHRSCLQRMALSAGMHYLKCPLCNDKEEFYKAVVSQGYYVPDRDAAWELEQNAFAEIYERPVVCSAKTCKCNLGREYDSDSGLWDIKLCMLCGSTAIHEGCRDGTEEHSNIYICSICKPAAPGDLENLIASIEKVQLQEESAVVARHGPIMPSRMSLRRTKPFNNSGPSSSRISIQNLSATQTDNIKTKTEASRLELNLKKPVRRIFEQPEKNIENILLSPIKMLEEGLTEKMRHHTDVIVDSCKVLEKLREKLKKPKPLGVKRRIINSILDELFANMLHDPKRKEALKEWNSPKKTFDIKSEEKEITENSTPNQISPEKKTKDLNSKPVKAISLHYTITNEKEDICETNGFKCNYKHKHIDSTIDGSKLCTAIDFAKDAYKENKRKIPLEETLPLKKRKYNCSMNRKDRSPTGNNDVENKQIDIEEEITNAESESAQRVEYEEHLMKDIKMEVVNKSNENKHEKVKDAVTHDKGVAISKPKREPSKNSIENAIELETEDTELVHVIQKEKAVNVRDGNMKSNCVDKSIADEDLKTCEDVMPRTIRNFSLNRSKKLVAKSIDLNNRLEYAETKSHMKLENVNELKDLEVNNEGDAEPIRDSLKDTKLRRKEKRRRTNSKKNDDTRHKRSYNDNGLSNKSVNKLIDITLNDKEKKLKLKYKKKQKKKLTIQNKEIKVKIRWKKEQFKLKITGKKEKRRKILEETPKVFKQYVLKYSPEMTSPKETIMRPDNDVTPVKKKYVKTEKLGDNMIQTDISSFFKAMPKVG